MFEVKSDVFIRWFYAIGRFISRHGKELNDDEYSQSWKLGFIEYESNIAVNELKMFGKVLLWF